jgi:hypothetical protein
MINSLYAAGDFLANFPAKRPEPPETTEGRVGFVHPYSVEYDRRNIDDQDTGSATLTLAASPQQKSLLKSIVAKTQEKYPDGSRSITAPKLGYLNMKEVVEKLSAAY